MKSNKKNLQSMKNIVNILIILGYTFPRSELFQIWQNINQSKNMYVAPHTGTCPFLQGHWLLLTF